MLNMVLLETDIWACEQTGLYIKKIIKEITA